MTRSLPVGTRKPGTLARLLEKAIYRMWCCRWYRLNDGTMVHEKDCPADLVAELRRSLASEQRKDRKERP